MNSNHFGITANCLFTLGCRVWRSTRHDLGIPWCMLSHSDSRIFHGRNVLGIPCGRWTIQLGRHTCTTTVGPGIFVCLRMVYVDWYVPQVARSNTNTLLTLMRHSRHGRYEQFHRGKLRYWNCSTQSSRLCHRKMAHCSCGLSVSMPFLARFRRIH